MTRRTIILVLSGLALGFLLGHRCHRDAPGEPPTLRVDTLFIYDTTKVTEPKYITKRVIDSIPYPVRDTIRVRDTLVMFLEREQVRWEDSLAVVYASGINPQVDSVFHFTREQVITREIPVKVRSRWGIGVQAGVGAGENGLTPYLGIGVTYIVLPW